MSNPIRHLGDGWYETEINIGEFPETWRFRAPCMRIAMEKRQQRIKQIKDRMGIYLSQDARRWAKSGRV